MKTCLVLLFAACGALLPAADDTVVFRSDVSLIRVDAQVVDRDNRAITGLGPEDFVLRDDGKTQQIRNFASEDMPLDVMLLLDVSASMRPHVERIASAAHQALTVLGPDDRVGIMVFDRATRVRMPLRKGRSNVENEFDHLLKQETFRGGTDITRGMYDAAAYLRREGRREARRAIVILTDDETERDRDEEGVLRELGRADAVMSSLIAPDAMGTRGMGRPRNGGSWPGGGPTGGGGGPLGGIILGRRGGNGPYGGGGNMGHHTKSAGTAEIARRSGGDSMPVDDASALETTLSRLRQRYALHFYAANASKTGQQRNIQLELASAVRRKYPDAEVRYRRVYMTDDAAAAAGSEPVMVTKAGKVDPEPVSKDAPIATPKRRRTVNEDGSSISVEAAPADTVVRRPSELSPATTPSSSQQGGWRRVDDSSKPPAGKDSPITTKDAAPVKDTTVDKDAPPAKDSKDRPSGWPRAKPDDRP